MTTNNTAETVYEARQRVGRSPIYEVVERVTDKTGTVKRIAASGIPSKHFANLIAEALAKATIYPPARFETVPASLRQLARLAVSDRDEVALASAVDAVLFDAAAGEPAGEYKTIGGASFWVTPTHAEVELAAIVRPDELRGRTGSARFYIDPGRGITRTEIIQGPAPARPQATEEVSP